MVATRSSWRLGGQQAQQAQRERQQASEASTSDRPTRPPRQRRRSSSGKSPNELVGDAEEPVRVELTWQQRQLLQQEPSTQTTRRPKHLQRRSASLHLAQPDQASANRSEFLHSKPSQRHVPRETATAKSQCPRPHSRRKSCSSAPDASFSSNLRSRSRSSDAAKRASVLHGSAYAEPSCFRSPLPHCLPHPPFSRSTTAPKAATQSPA